MNAYFFDKKGRTSRISVLALLQTARDSNHIREGSVIEVLFRYINVSMTDAIVRRIRAEDKYEPSPFSVPSNDDRPQKCFRLYFEMVKCLLQEFLLEQAIVKLDVAILRYMHLRNLKSQRDTDKAVAESWKLVDEHNWAILDEVFIEEVGASMHQSQQHLFAQNPPADLNNIDLHAGSLSSV